MISHDQDKRELAGTPEEAPRTPKPRGFASMDRAKQRAIASKGGKIAHQRGHAHEFTSEEARAAGRKGGQAAHLTGRAHEFTSEEARIAGRKGGQASHGARAKKGGDAKPWVPENTPAQEAAPVSPEA